MGLQTELVGTHSGGHKVAMTMYHKSDIPNGAVVYTEPYRNLDTEISPFLNPEYGLNMNINAAFGGTPEVVHVGISDGVHWTGSNIIGSDVNFDHSNRANTGTVSVRVNRCNVGDIFQFDKGSDLSVTSYKAITMFININNNWSSGDSYSLYCYDTGSSTQIGSSVLLEDYMNEFNFDVWQAVSIPFADLGISETDFDAIRIECLAEDNNTNPQFFIDDMQIEQAGTPAEFRTNTASGKKYFIHRLRITMVDAFSATLADGTVPALSYNKFMGVDELSSGILLQRFVDAETTFSVSMRSLSDFLNVGFNIVEKISDGTNTMIVIEQEFPDPLVVFGGDNSYIAIKISDDLSGLISFRAVARGSIEV